MGVGVSPDGIPSAAGRRGATTNQRMEINVALEAVRTLSAAHPDVPIDVVSDSTYVVNCFRDRWWAKWVANGVAHGGPQARGERDLWEPLVDLVKTNPVTFRWVKGHSGDRLNDLVDELAVAAIPR